MRQGRTPGETLNVLSMYLLGLYAMPHTLLGTGDIAINEINMVPGFTEIAPNCFTIDTNTNA